MPSDAEYIDALRAVLRDDAAFGGRVSAETSRRIETLLARSRADGLGLPIPVHPHDTRPLMVRTDSRRPEGERIAALETDMDTMKEQLASADRKLDQVLENLARANGGMKVLTWLGGLMVSGGVLSFIGSAFGIFHAAQGK